ncbi:fimbria/pilus outer membrane usher protein [Ralstonia insidiosa]|uniref:Fimbrial biogenesis outer membrane usher protein n=1 Tax=Ralstonia insidiosa TaxID=190721 RepID=A0A848P5K2_9RALS|nr:fimbria/pilus outer membrane usher protein [Ralstonia insidiosa]NMV40575.1 fimbrial biogenesis outer membrane usher protein [Ralstonia insidiosa]
MLSRNAMTRHARAVGLPRGYVLTAMIAAALAPKAYAEPTEKKGVAPSASGTVTFDPDFLPKGSAAHIDISRFEKAGYITPGTYRADVVLNQQWRAREDVTFATEPGSDETQLCLDAQSLSRYGVDVWKVAMAAAEGKAERLPEGRFCAPLSRYIPDATMSFDMGNQELTLTVPQIYEQRNARGYVDPSQWDAGTTAATVSYNANAYTNTGGTNYSSGYLGINAAAHSGSWHVYHQGSLNLSSFGGTSYQSAATYLQHDLPAWREQLTAGDLFTSGEMFDSVRVRGVRLATEDRMLPQSLRGFAPVVRGVAETNARVVVRQNGYLIYETNAAPGPFVIDDLYPTGYGGDLNVEVIEADGRVKRFVVPFSTVTQLLRPGIDRWSATVGKVNGLNLQDAPNILQGTYQRGLTNILTAYGGVTLASGYRSVLAGSAINTQVGAFSLDVTQAQQSVSGQSTSNGVSVRLGYNKNIVETGTNLAFAAYRYSTNGFVGLSDMVAVRDAAARGIPTDTVLRQRSRLDVNLAQSLGEKAGSLNVSGSMRNYWSGGGSQLDYTIGYSNNWRNLTYSITAQRTRESLSAPGRWNEFSQIPGAIDAPIPTIDSRWDTRVFFTVSIPLGSKVSSPTVTATHNQSHRDGSSTQVSLSGNAGEDQRIGYGVTAGRNDGSSALSANARYNGSYGQVGTNYSQGNGYRQFGVGASGGLVVHGGGVTFAPTLGETIGLIYAPDAAGARVQNGQGAVVDRRGYAVVPSLNPYELNTVALDPKGMSTGTELKSTTVSVAPRAGSVVKLTYETKAGRALIIDSQQADGKPLPFGAQVEDDQGTNVGVVGQASRVIATGLLASGGLTVRWGEGAENSCRINVTLPDKPAASGYERFDAVCEPLAAAAAPAAEPLKTSSAFSQAPQPHGAVLTKARFSSMRTTPSSRTEMQG